MKSLRILALLVLSSGLLFTAACDKQGVATVEDPDTKATAYTMSPRDQRLIAEKYSHMKADATGLLSQITKEGTGTAKPKYAAVVKANYELRTLDGKVLENSQRDNGGPIIFPVGVGRVIKAWDQTIADMKLGEKRTIVVPHWLGYGVAGSPPKIAPYATLVFDIELVSF